MTEQRPIRKVLLINRPFQLRMIGWMTGLSLAPICTFFLAHFYFFRKLRRLGQEIELPQDDIYFRFIEGLSQDLFIIFIVCSLLTIAVVCVLGLLLSHRIAGPIHRLKTYFQEVERGEAEYELAFRQGDFFMDVPPVVNQGLRAIRGRRP